MQKSRPSRRAEMGCFRWKHLPIAAIWARAFPCSCWQTLEVFQLKVANDSRRNHTHCCHPCGSQTSCWICHKHSYMYRLVLPGKRWSIMLILNFTFRYPISQQLILLVVVVKVISFKLHSQDTLKKGPCSTNEGQTFWLEEKKSSHPN